MLGVALKVKFQSFFPHFALLGYKFLLFLVKGGDGGARDGLLPKLFPRAGHQKVNEQPPSLRRG